MVFSNKDDFFSYFLDENWTISINFLKSKNWIAVPVPNTLTLIESEWLSNAISLFGDKYLAYSFEYNGDITMNLILNSQENLIQTDFNHFAEYVIITNEHLDFLYFKNQNNLYHLFCGTPDFVSNCLHCSFEMAKKIFFAYGVNDFNSNQDEYDDLIRIWNLYQQASFA